MNCWLVPFGIDALAGVTETETRIGGITETLAELLTVPEVAVMLALPIWLAVTNPPELTGAAGDEEAQVAVAVKSCVLPSV